MKAFVSVLCFGFALVFCETLTFTAPTAFPAGVVTEIDVELLNVGLPTLFAPKKILRCELQNPVPVIVTAVPPAIGPSVTSRLVTCGDVLHATAPAVRTPANPTIMTAATASPSLRKKSCCFFIRFSSVCQPASPLGSMR
jgi:hypothetical protein